MFSPGGNRTTVNSTYYFTRMYKVELGSNGSPEENIWGRKNNFYTSPSLLKATKSRRFRWINR
jgi:hypothetical protein